MDTQLDAFRLMRTRSLTRRCNGDVPYDSCQQHRQRQLSTFHFFSSLVWFSAPLQHFLARCKNKFRGLMSWGFSQNASFGYPAVPRYRTWPRIICSSKPTVLGKYSTDDVRFVRSIPSVPHFAQPIPRILDFPPKVETLDKPTMVTIRSSDFFLECAPAANHRWVHWRAASAPPWRRSKR